MKERTPPKAQSENSQKLRFALTLRADTWFPFSAEARGSGNVGRGGAWGGQQHQQEACLAAQALGPRRRPADSEEAVFYGPPCHAEAVKSHCLGLCPLGWECEALHGEGLKFEFHPRMHLGPPKAFPPQEWVPGTKETRELEPKLVIVQILAPPNE